MLEVVCSPNAKAERSYIIDWVMGGVFGLEYELRFEEGLNGRVRIQTGGKGDEKILELADVFLERIDSQWLQPSTLPRGALTSYMDLSVLFGCSSLREGGKAEADLGFLPLDVFGSLFFLISRYEEAVSAERDEHDRFPCEASFLEQNGLSQRALGNEYIEFFWTALKKIWPQLERKKQEFRIRPSHDIDHPSAVWNPWLRVGKSAAHCLSQGKFRESGLLFAEQLRYRGQGNWKEDVNDTIDFLVNTASERGLESTFYYIPEQTHPKKDRGMPLSHPHVQDQWKRISEGGHFLGVHPGYETYQSPERIKCGVEIVRREMANLGIEQDELGGRQHYLRWQTPDTAKHYEKAGLKHDSTLGWASTGGFRCGVCYEFPIYDLKERRATEVIERPLILMDVTLLNDCYLGLGCGEKAFDYAMELRKECERFGGDFTLLWHNNRLATPEVKDFYCSLLS